jgi:hypothetical protein
MGFFIEIDPKAIEDIQNAIEYYDEKQLGLGEKFEQTLYLITKKSFF